MPRRTPTKFRPLAAADEAPQPRRVDHALDLDAAAAVAQALRAQQQAQRVEAKKPRSGGAFANTADEPQRPQQRSAAQPAQPALRRRLDLREDIAAARDVEPQPTPAEDAHEQDAATHARRYAKPKILEVPDDDGLYRAIFGGHATTEPVVICLCERCGYGRPATDLETPFSNGIGEPHYNVTFGEGMYAQGAPIPLKQPTFICKRCPRYGSRPYGVGGARRIAPPAPEIAIATPAASTYEATPIEETPQSKERREFWKECVANSKNPEYQEALNESRATAEEERKKRRTQLAEVTQGTPWKVLDLAKLEPPRRNGSRALNVAALLEDFRRLGKSSGLPFCIRFALEAALLKNEPMKNEVTCYNVVRTFSTKVVPKVAGLWKSRRRGQLESWWTAVALGDPLALLVGRLAEERRDGLSPDLALRAFSKAAIEAMDDALRHRRQTVGSLEAEHALLHSTDVSAKARVQAPNLRARLSHNLQTDTVELIPTSIEFSGHKRATHFELAASDRFVSSRIKFDAGEIVEHFTKRGGELAPIRCCGEDCYYLFDKGISPTIHFLRTRPEADELDRFYSAENFLQSLGDFTGVKDPKLGARISLANTSTTPTVTLALHQIRVIPDVWRAGYCWSDGCGVMSQELADLVSRAMGTRVTACQIRIGLCKGMLVIDPTLTGVQLLLRPSMIKGASSKACAEIEIKSPSRLLDGVQVESTLIPRRPPLPRGQGRGEDQEGGQHVVLPGDHRDQQHVDGRTRPRRRRRAVPPRVDE